MKNIIEPATDKELSFEQAMEYALNKNKDLYQRLS